tara:strand:- start:300 stop:623 length:324 start_codon:yes stop_codon:yes gene_type:complete
MEENEENEKTNLVENLTDNNSWIRVIYMLFFAAAFYVTAWVVLAITILQTIFKLIKGEELKYLSEFGWSLGKYLHQITNFTTFDTNIKPWPFSYWQGKHIQRKNGDK